MIRAAELLEALLNGVAVAAIGAGPVMCFFTWLIIRDIRKWSKRP